MEEQFLNKDNCEPENVPMTDEELEAFALQLMEELPLEEHRLPYQLLSELQLQQP